MRDLPVSGTSVGLMILRIYSRLVSSGESPPCMQRIFSSMRAATGRQLKQSVKVFQSLIEYRLLPDDKFISFTFIIKAIDSVDGCAFVVAPEQKKVFRILDFIRQQQTDGFQTLFSYSMKNSKYLYQRNLPRISNYFLVGIHHIRTILKDQNTIHEHHLNIHTD